MNSKWSEADKLELKNKSKTYTDAELATYFTLKLGRSVSMYAIRKLRQRLGIRKSETNGRPPKNK